MEWNCFTLHKSFRCSCSCWSWWSWSGWDLRWIWAQHINWNLWWNGGSHLDWCSLLDQSTLPCLWFLCFFIGSFCSSFGLFSGFCNLSVQLHFFGLVAGSLGHFGAVDLLLYKPGRSWGVLGQSCSRNLFALGNSDQRDES